MAESLKTLGVAIPIFPPPIECMCLGTKDCPNMGYGCAFTLRGGMGVLEIENEIETRATDCPYSIDFVIEHLVPGNRIENGRAV